MQLIQWVSISASGSCLHDFSVRHGGLNTLDTKVIKQSYKAGKVAVARIYGGQRLSGLVSAPIRNLDFCDSVSSRDSD